MILTHVQYSALLFPSLELVHNQQEGSEYDVFEDILSEGIDLLWQISFELHYITQMQDLDWHGRQRTAGEIAFLSQVLYEAGYRVISREDNPECKHCSEFTIVRFQCPL